LRFVSCAYIVNSQPKVRPEHSGDKFFARVRSKAEFIAKLGIVLEEADETVFWLELLLESGIVKHERLEVLLDEAHQLTSIFVASICTAKGIAS